MAGEGYVFMLKKINKKKKNSKNFFVWKDLQMDVLEKLCLDIRRSKSKPVVVVTWYRLPDANIDIFSHFEPRQ